jgi:hypothetical protein
VSDPPRQPVRGLAQNLTRIRAKLLCGAAVGEHRTKRRRERGAAKVRHQNICFRCAEQRID